ncbi:MAG: hypothetical protein ACTH31_05665, partial [Pseudoclavibacter sp.]
TPRGAESATARARNLRRSARAMATGGQPTIVPPAAPPHGVSTGAPPGTPGAPAGIAPTPPSAAPLGPGSGPGPDAHGAAWRAPATGTVPSGEIPLPPTVAPAGAAAPAPAAPPAPAPTTGGLRITINGSELARPSAGGPGTASSAAASTAATGTATGVEQGSAPDSPRLSTPVPVDSESANSAPFIEPLRAWADDPATATPSVDTGTGPIPTLSLGASAAHPPSPAPTAVRLRQRTGTIELPTFAGNHESAAADWAISPERTATGGVPLTPPGSRGSPGNPPGVGIGTGAVGTIDDDGEAQGAAAGQGPAGNDAEPDGRAGRGSGRRNRTSTNPRRSGGGRIRALFTAPALWLGIAAIFVCVVASWSPSFSTDEAATIEAARRDWAGMWALITDAHAANGVWMALTHLWIGAFGASEVSLRLLPAIAAGATVAGTTIIGTKLAGTRVGVLAGAVAVVLPRLTQQGTEASSLSLAIALVTWATVALTWAVSANDPIPRFDVPSRLVSRRNRARRAAATWRHIGRWSVVGVLLAVAAWVFVPAVLMTLVHPLFVLVASARRGALRGATLSSLGAIALASPLLVVLVMQHYALLGRGGSLGVTPWSWIAEPTVTGAAWAIPVFIMVVVTLAIAAWRIRNVVEIAGTSALLLGTMWLVVPTIAFWLLQLVAPGTFSPDYLAFTAPAVALLLGAAMSARPVWLTIVLLVLMLQTCLPTLVMQKMPTAKDGSDDRATSAYIAERSAEGDGIIFANTETDPKSARVMLSTYPEAFGGLLDLTLAQSGEAAGTLWDTSVDIATVPSRLDEVDRVWVVQPESAPINSNSPELAVYAGEGFAVISSAVFNEFIVYEFVRTDAFGLDENGEPPAPDPLPELPEPVPTNYDGTDASDGEGSAEGSSEGDGADTGAESSSGADAGAESSSGADAGAESGSTEG